MINLATAGAIALGAFGVAPSFAADIVGLITKTETNPFFVKMREGAQAKADELGLKFQAFAGKYDGDQ
jgi:fructose transport system substrate-binding protein